MARTIEEKRASERERQRKLRLTPEWKDWSFKYNRSKKRKEVAKKFFSSDKGKAYIKNWRENNREKCNAASLAWYKRNAETVSKKRKEEHYKIIRKKSEINYSQKNIEKRRAKSMVNNAIKAGRINPQLCQICGIKAEGHHNDYSKPLEVIWLCRKHHAEIHRKLRSLK